MTIDLTGDSDDWLHRDPDEVPPLRYSERYSEEDFAEETREFLQEPLERVIRRERRFVAKRVLRRHSKRKRLPWQKPERGVFKHGAPPEAAETLLYSVGYDALQEIVEEATAKIRDDAPAKDPEDLLSLVSKNASKRLLELASSDEELPDPLELSADRPRKNRRLRDR